MSISAPVEITNLNSPERRAAEKAIIEDVGDFGCQFSMRGPVQKGNTIIIKLLADDGVSPSDVPAKFFEVMWVEQGTEISTVGARILQGEKLANCKLALDNRTDKYSV